MKELDKSWHLADTKDEVSVTEFEFQLWRAFNSFIQWQEDCQRYICGDDLGVHDIALLHIIRMNDRPKTIYEIGRLLGRDDPNNIQYSIGKLLKKGFVEKMPSETKIIFISTGCEELNGGYSFCGS